MYVQKVKETGDTGSFAIDRIRGVLEKYTQKPIGVKVTFATCRHLQSLTARVMAGPNFSVVASHQAGSVYEAIDGVVEKIEKQIRRKKKKLLRKSRSHPPLKLLLNEEHTPDLPIKRPLRGPLPELGEVLGGELGKEQGEGLEVGLETELDPEFDLHYELSLAAWEGRLIH